MNQDSNNLNQNDYNLQGNNQTQNQLLNINQNNNIQQRPKSARRLKWWIPLLFFLGGILMTVGSIVAEVIIRSQEVVLDYQIRNHPDIMIFRWLAVICWLLVIPSLIIVIVKYNKKTPNEKNKN